MTPRVIVQPIEEPISIDEARSHLEAPAYGDSDVDSIDDEMILGWIGAAREYCEGYLGLSLAPQTLEIALDRFPCGYRVLPIELPMGPVRQILSVNWGSGSATSSEGELDDADFILDTYSRPSRLVPTTSWPSVTSSTNAVRIRYSAGFGVDSDGGEPLPRSIRSAILLVLGHLYANRENTSAESLAAIPLGAHPLMDLSGRRERKGFA